MDGYMKQAKGKTSTIFYHDWLTVFEKMERAEVGDMVIALLKFDATGETPVFKDRMMDIIFADLSRFVKSNREAYEQTCERRRVQKGTKGTLSIQKDTKDTLSTQEYTKVPDKEKDKENDNDKEKEKEKEKDIYSVSANEYDRILSAWNSQTFIKAKIDRIPFGSRRYDNTQLCIAEYGFSTFIEEILNLDNNAFFNDWHPSYDWFSNPNNFMKVRDGNYREKRKDPNEIDWEAL